MKRNQQQKGAKSIRSVLTSLILALLILTSVTACSSVSELDVKASPVERVKLNIPNTAPPKLEGIEFLVVTRDNFDELFDSLGDEERQVIFGVTTDDYERLSLNLRKTQNYILLQNTILQKYRDYYEGLGDGE